MHFQPTSPLIPILLGKEKDVRYSIDTAIRFWPVFRRSLGWEQCWNLIFFSNVSKLFRHFCSYAFLWIFGIWSPFLSISLASKYRGSLPFVISQFTISQFMIPMILFQASISWIPRCFIFQTVIFFYILFLLFSCIVVLFFFL